LCADKPDCMPPQRQKPDAQHFNIYFQLVKHFTSARKATLKNWSTTAAGLKF